MLNFLKIKLPKHIIIKATIVIICIVASIYTVRIVRPFFVSKYGIDPYIIAVLFVIAECFFDLGIVLMLLAVGYKRFSWKDLRHFRARLKASEATLTPLYLMGLIINRATWIIPFVYIIIVGWSKLPRIITLLCALEIAITLWIGLMLFPRKKLGSNNKA